MKNLKNISILMLTAFIFLLISSCDDTTDKFVVSETSPVTLSELAISDIELDATNTNNPAITFNWTEADYGQQASVNYSLEVSADDSFTNSIIPATVNGNNTITLSVSELNAAAGNAGLNPFEWATLYARVVSNIGTQNGLPVPSNSISFNVYPYFNYVFNDYYLVGNATPDNWNNNANNSPLFRDSENPNLFHFTGYFKGSNGDYNSGRFKVLETKGLWQPQWGVTDNEGSDDIKTSGSIAGNPGTQDSDPGRFGVPTDGYYTFTIDFSTKTYTTEPFNASGMTSPASLSIQGSSVETTAMTSLAFDGHIWYATGLHLTPGDVTFLADSATMGSTTSFSGVATVDGGSIPVIVEDDYDVWYDDLNGRYIMIPLNL